MTQTIQLKSHNTIAQLRQAIKHSDDEKQKTRIRAIIKLKQGSTKTDVAHEMVVSRKTVIYWVTEYNQGGIDALSMSKGGRPGGNPIWDSTIFDNLIEEVSKGGQYWSIPLMQEWVEKNHNEIIPESTIWYHLKRLDYSYKSARPHPYKGDVEKQNEFKKKVLVQK